MKKATLIMLIITSITLNSQAMANGQKQVMDGQVELPSTETQNQLDRLSPHEIGTRQAPDEEGWAQKETPISGTNASIIILMISATLFYAYFKKPNIQNLKK